ncbi:MAG: MBL fold metallo-hydrolase [Clostridia bacterium]|nr:MBL fold metallo-hydrolase [Clostridia bacterium]
MKKSVALIILSLLLLFTGCVPNVEPPHQPDLSIKELDGCGLQVHFIDVGQGDCVLLKSENASVLIDSGTSESGTKINAYLNSLDIDELDYFICTHPHDDHIGGAATVIRNNKIKTVFMNGDVSTSYSFEKLLDALEITDTNAQIPKLHMKYTAQDICFTFLSPDKDYENMNDNSLVVMAEYKNCRILITGDAEKDVERSLIESGCDLKADLLKVSHHGSRNASTEMFLAKVSPAVCVIQSEQGNSYGHPHEEAIDRLKKSGANILRCDELGSIVIYCDGEAFYDENKTPYRAGENLFVNSVYIGNNKSKKYHTQYCRSLPGEKNRIVFNSREDAEKAGYTPCGNCN